MRGDLFYGGASSSSAESTLLPPTQVLSKLDTTAAAKVVGVLEAADAADMLEKAIRFKRWDTQRVAAVLAACPPEPATRILGYDPSLAPHTAAFCPSRQRAKGLWG
jgi:hypothetical protein